MTDAAVTDGPASPPPAAPPGDGPRPAAGRARARWLTLTLPGLWGAVLVGALSFTPSLLPRPGLVQGATFGLTAVLGYGVGLVVAWVWRQFPDRAARTPRRSSWLTLAVVGGALLLVAVVLGYRWQVQTRELVALAPETPLAQLLVPVVGALVFTLLLLAARGVRWLYRRVAGLLARWMGRNAARAVGGLVAAAVLVLLFSGVIRDLALGALDRSFAALDTSTEDSASQPTSTDRSGGPDSLVAWDTLGRQGRNFTGRGPTAEQISAFTGQPAPTPIRAYAGLASADGVEERARLAVDDLERAGGFRRANLLVAGVTGTGWVDPAALTSFEYETGGDSAAVAIQYSYFPSWLSFLVDQDPARQAGRALFDAVYERWSALPLDARPKLYVFGESLGSFSMEAAFSGEFDLANRTDGALFAGPPNFNPLHAEFTANREAGSPQIAPVYRDGRTVRFSGDPAQPAAPADQTWSGSRVLYLQHPSDPISWWSPDLILGRPDWLTEPRGRDVSDAMVWLPLVTFWQTTFDMTEWVDTPNGHGHTFSQEYVDGWAQVLQPPGWTAAKADELREIVAAGPS
ncbi:hypothetical protein FDO65_01080 [Nakamurella flava]|uniref:Alpha/beta-hydrolase family protein n=1 Tax=Nakamurella flava TaxID=2576308 RepID=A0A4U6QIX3_9ACTN|nr:alpha/beta-hydrolase family protein [Nakamurella flava]TKV60343.1 hypothetical protein FDO65_01080 [Nakamurella flava]